MTNIIELFSGIGVIIDDEIKDTESSIKKVMSSFEEKHIPFLAFEDLPSMEIIHNFHSVSFVLLDWKWNESASDETLLRDNHAFITELHKVCFVPIFIFTDEEPADIISQLEGIKVYSDAKNSLLFVKHKSEVDTAKKLFDAINDWVKSTLSVYIIKEWELKKRLASNSLFQNLYKINPNWVNVFLETSKKDDLDAAFELDELLFENLRSRMPLMNMMDLPINRDNPTIYEASEIRDIMQGQRFLPADKLLSEMIFTGDVYLNEQSEYFINVRPQCDCIPRNGTILGDVELYLIKGTEKDISKCNYSSKFGNFSDSETKVTIFPIFHKAIQFELGAFSVKKFSEMREKRIGRLLPPFITKLVQKYALYMQRQALPRIPEEATKL
jgi:Zn-finger protein